MVVIVVVVVVRIFPSIQISPYSILPILLNLTPYLTLLDQEDITTIPTTTAITTNYYPSY